MSKKLFEPDNSSGVKWDGDKKGGPGEYGGEPGLPGRTSSPNAVPEKTKEEYGGLPKQS